MNLYWRSLLLLGVAIAQTYGAIYDQVSQLPIDVYDYIVVGGGTAGNVIANRLTEDTSIRVLVLEAGGSNQGALASTIPLLFYALSPDTQYDWNYTTAPQSGFNGRSVPYPRGRILGGSSSINGMAYNTGSRDDWDRISRITGDPAWTWDAMAHYRDLNQRYVPPNDGHDDTNQYLPWAHSRDGMVSISLPGFPEDIDSRVIATTAESGFASEFPFQRDMNTGDTIGVGWVQAAIGNGRRSSSATTYVGPNYINRPNLHILLHAQATKLLEATNHDSTTPCFNGVEFGLTTGSSGQRWEVTARREIILSAGVFNTPQLLMLSGIGDPSELTSLGITTRVNLFSVGKNMSDHTYLSNAWQINTNQTINTYLTTENLPHLIQQWNQTHQGLLSWTTANQMAWLRLPQDDPIIQTYGDPSPGPTSANFQLIWTNAWGIPGVAKPEGSWMTIATNLISPTSRGEVKLRSANPFDPPIINPNFLTTDFDIKTIVAALKTAQRFVTAKAWEGFVLGAWEQPTSASTDEEFVQYARNHSSTELHAVGTAAMSEHGAQWGVLDPDLRVKGTTGLRVVDASALPYVPTGHTHGPVYLLAEVAAAKIKADY